FAVRLVEKGGYPAVVLVVSLFSIWIFRAALRDLIRRIYSIGAKGVRAKPSENQQLSVTVESNSGASGELTNVLSSQVDPNLLDLRANSIYAELESRGVRPEDRETTLVRLLAASLIRELWERTYALIFGSQIRLLQSINENYTGLPEEEAEATYRAAAEQHPEIYNRYPFENWIRFIEWPLFVRREDGRLLITPIGRGFLKHLIAQGLSFDRPA
ncbi:MAG TPA: hypothetical protein VIX59_20180, partial [Candidatus Binataceae bacterium]